MADHVADVKSSIPYPLRVFSAVSPRGFYGYVILCAAGCGLLSASAGHSYSIGVFTDSFIADLHLSRGLVSTIWMNTLVLSALYVNVVGRAADRFGAATVVRAAVLPYAASLCVLASASGPVSLSAGYVLVRMLGPETIDFACRLCVSMWWVRRRGFAVGILNALGALMVALPSITAPAVAVFGWRHTLIGMGVGMGSGAALASTLLLDSPEKHGLTPDGDGAAGVECEALERKDGAHEEEAADAEADLQPDSEREPEVTCAEAARSPIFWLIQLQVLVVSVPWQGLNFHMASVIAESWPESSGQGVVGYVYLPLAAASFVAAVVYGNVIDRLSRRTKPLALVPPLLFMAAALCLFSRVRAKWQVALCGASVGAFSGMSDCVNSVLPAALFGRTELGAIQASTYVTAQLASAAGAVVLGISKDALGSFRPFFHLLIALQLGLAAILVLHTVGVAAAPRLAAVRPEIECVSLV